MALQVPLSICWLVRPLACHNSQCPLIIASRAGGHSMHTHRTLSHRRSTNDVCISPFVLVQYSGRITLGKDILVGMLTVITRTAKGCTSRILLDGSFSRADAAPCDEMNRGSVVGVWIHEVGQEVGELSCGVQARAEIPILELSRFLFCSRLL